MQCPPVKIGLQMLAALSVICTVTTLRPRQQREVHIIYAKPRKLLELSTPQKDTYSNDLVWQLPAGRFNWSGVVPGAGTALEKATLTLTIVAYYYAAMRLARSQQQANLIGSPSTWCELVLYSQHLTLSPQPPSISCAYSCNELWRSTA